MARQARAQSWANNMARRTTPCQTSYTRRLRFEPLEDRRMLSIIADGFDPTFAQVSRVVGAEAAVLTVDTSGHFAVFYRPNSEFGYVNPETGDLLAVTQFTDTSVANVLDATVSGNVSDLIGVHYSNGQLIEDVGGNLYHKDGSIMRSNGVWTYDAGATLESGGNYFWSNGRSMKSGATYTHPNNVSLESNLGPIFYAANTTFFNNTTGEEFYAASVTMRSAAGAYSYETGAQLDNNNVIHYLSGATMVDQLGNVYNENGTPSSTPFAQHYSYADPGPPLPNSEVNIAVSATDSETTIAVRQSVSGSLAVYVTRVHLTYGIAGDYNENGVVDAADYVLWRANLGKRTARCPGTTPPVVGADDYDTCGANFGEVFTPGAGTAVGQAVPDSSLASAESQQTRQAQPDLLVRALSGTLTSPLAAEHLRRFGFGSFGETAPDGQRVFPPGATGKPARWRAAGVRKRVPGQKRCDAIHEAIDFARYVRHCDG